jgi:hypothetical protein
MRVAQQWQALMLAAAILAKTWEVWLLRQKKAHTGRMKPQIVKAKHSCALGHYVSKVQKPTNVCRTCGS